MYRNFEEYTQFEHSCVSNVVIFLVAVKLIMIQHHKMDVCMIAHMQVSICMYVYFLRLIVNYMLGLWQEVYLVSKLTKHQAQVAVFDLNYIRESTVHTIISLHQTVITLCNTVPKMHPQLKPLHEYVMR